jgi:hypothetical protein
VAYIGEERGLGPIDFGKSFRAAALFLVDVRVVDGRNASMLAKSALLSIAVITRMLGS